MREDATAVLQGLIDRLRRGDRQALHQLLERAHTRLRKLANRMLSESFPALGRRHDLDSVVHESWVRLAQALEKTEPPTVADFFRLAAFKVRQVLLDMADRDRRRQREVGREDTTGDSGVPGPPAGQTYNPERLALWAEFHERVSALPEQERAVFEMHYYLGLPQSEIARVLELHPRKVSYLWVAATDKLARYLSEVEGML
jgi:RNA polymerase sigma factor (sigma-70 family)